MKKSTNRKVENFFYGCLSEKSLYTLTHKIHTLTHIHFIGIHRYIHICICMQRNIHIHALLHTHAHILS